MIVIYIYIHSIQVYLSIGFLASTCTYDFLRVQFLIPSRPVPKTSRVLSGNLFCRTPKFELRICCKNMFGVSYTSNILNHIRISTLAGKSTYKSHGFPVTFPSNLAIESHSPGPGFVNAHTHSSQMLGRGLVSPLPLDLWILQMLAVTGATGPEVRFSGDILGRPWHQQVL